MKIILLYISLIVLFLGIFFLAICRYSLKERSKDVYYECESYLASLSRVFNLWQSVFSTFGVKSRRGIILSASYFQNKHCFALLSVCTLLC